MDFRNAASGYAQQYGIPPDLFLRLVQQESSWRPDAVSSAGAIGLAQLMPGTARELGVDPRDPMQNLEGGARYLRQQYDRFGSWPLALAAYNAGPGRVASAGGIPNISETQNYVNRVWGGFNGSTEATPMVMNPDPQPQRMGFFGNLFGGGQPQQPAAADPTSTDPFANLSRSQRTMLGFAALRDAAASLEGRDSNYFGDALGGFEAARERERLRAQGEYANRNQAIFQLAQLEFLASQPGYEGLRPLVEAQRQMLAPALGGTGMPTPVAGGAPSGGPSLPTAAPGDFTGGTMPAGAPTGPQGTPGAPPTGVIYDAGGVTPTQYTGEPEVAPAPATPETPADPIAALDAQLADIDRQIEEIIQGQPTGSDVTSGAILGIPVGDDPQAQSRLARLQDQEARLLAEREALATEQAADAAAAAREAEEAAATQSRMEPLINNALNFLLDDEGNLRTVTSQVADFSGFGAGLFPGVNAGDARLARAAVTELGAIAAMRSVREAREAGFGGSLSDADILLIQRSGGTFDLSQPEATRDTLLRLQAEMGGNGASDGGNGDWQDLGNGIRIRVRD